MKAFKVQLKEPLSLADPTGYLIDVGHTAFKKAPKAFYLLPDSAFWMKRYQWGTFASFDPVEAELKDGKLVEVKVAKKPAGGKDEKQ